MLFYIFSSSCDIASDTVPRLYYSNSDLNTSCVFVGNNYKLLEAENIY